MLLRSIKQQRVENRKQKFKTSLEYDISQQSTKCIGILVS